MPPELWTLRSPTGVRAEILGYGAVLRSLRVPDTGGESADVVLGLPTAAAYAQPHPYFGATVGRYANRIAHGRFTLDGTAHRVPVNDRGHALHGGPEGFHRRVWRARPRAAAGTDALELTLHSPDGDMGFPGALDVTLVYSLDEHGTLALDYTARCDRPTVLNLTHHSYFNLLGAGEGDVLGHTLALDAAAYLPVTPEGIPYGPTAATAGTPFDFGRPRPIGTDIDDPHPQVAAAGGYDHCYVLSPARPDGAPRRAARLTAPGGGRRMEVWTTEPGMQLYTGNTLDGSLPGGSAKPYGRHGGICLETQSFPDSPNRPAYPSTVLQPGSVFHSRTEYRFPHLAGGPDAAR
ncbi:aldose epimerase family protein [Streptomyces sp. NBC_01497]|uniref:aldose epimerase family protein n=1 Tax=Streptomyces sp. NBC_01497 TaxID=2903885 RepID=UPI002E35800B|nr:aldose epimerase family protein [Streptomyces sp. NBC_01497]